MIDIISPMVKKFLPFAKERMGFSNPPKLFLRTDNKNAGNPLGKTAYYDPNEKSITLYTTGRHPKDVMRSFSHELVHHAQNCRGEFDKVGEMGEGYAQNDEHLREMEREAYETGNMCFRDWEDSIKSTIYYEHLQKGENKMSIKDWKNKELTTILSEAWGFKFNTLEEFNEFNGTGEVQEEAEDAELQEEEEVEEGRQPRMQRQRQDLNSPTQAKRATRPSPEERGDDEDEDAEKKVAVAESIEEAEVFAPNHYCVHHGGVSHNGKTEMAEAVSHNYNEELGKVTHYDMKLADGTILEGVAAEDIEVTNASLAEGHGHPMKRDDDEEELDEAEKPDYIDLDKDGDKEESMKDAAEDAKKKKLKEAISKLLKKRLKG
tara:strand:- start:13 stop:1140 length:1128 start_codon:yes stop_codon:yes gene_type:complete